MAWYHVHSEYVQVFACEEFEWMYIDGICVAPGWCFLPVVVLVDP